MTQQPPPSIAERLIQALSAPFQGPSVAEQLQTHNAAQQQALAQGGVRGLMQDPRVQDLGTTLAENFNFLGPIKAYHGSPHVFDKFDMSKVGTGEGAQAYGHGLYFAENPRVATDYREKLAPPRYTFQQGGQDVHPADIAKTLRRSISYQEDPHGVRDIFAQEFVNELEKVSGKPDVAEILLGNAHRKSAAHLPPEQVEAELQMLARIRQLYEEQGFNYGKRPGGALYHTELQVEPEDLLDWDVPLSAQPPKVQEALAKLGLGPEQFPEVAPSEFFGDVPLAPAIGEEVYKKLAELQTRASMEQGYVGGGFHAKEGERLASQRLREAGVPGIRYKDAGSRWGDDEQATRNIVLFADELAKILARE